MEKPTRILLFLLAVILLGCREKPAPVSFDSLTEEQRHQSANALVGMTVADGLEAALFAAEPELSNPTNIAVDAKGRVWVCEADNYRLPYNPKFKKREEGDRILILEDTDGDGKSDKVKTFYQGPDMVAPLGIAVLGSKIYVSVSPVLLVFEDKDGDDVPDSRDTLFMTEGGADNDHGLHAVSFGLDGKLYFNHGNAVTGLYHKDGSPVLDQYQRPIRTKGQPYLQGLALRCDPDGSHVEVLGHNFRNPYEVTVDHYGNVWQSDNDDDGNKGTRMNFVLEGGNFGYVDEMTGDGWQKRRLGWSDEIPVRHWHQNDPGVVPNLLYNGAGSPTGLMIYNGKLLPQPFQGAMIHCEALQNEVRAYPTSPDGAGYKAETAVIMKSENQWFRPSDVAAAPDGFLLVADWYDPGVGGHKFEDVSKGRIFRVAPNAGKYRFKLADLATLDGRIKELSNPNMDVRYQAWMGLMKLGTEARPALTKEWESGDPVRKVQALWLLARLPDANTGFLGEALKDEDPEIRVSALRAVRQFIPDQLPGFVEKAVKDPSPAVRREAALALRDLGTPQAAGLWAELADQFDGKDRWYLEALGIGCDRYADLYFQAWLDLVGENWKTAAGKQLVWRSRSALSSPMLAQMIREEQDPKMTARDFRSFQFKPAEGRSDLIAGFLTDSDPEKAAMALGLLDEGYARSHPAALANIRKLIPAITGTPEWVTAVRNLNLKDQVPALMNTFMESEDPGLASDAAGAFFDLGGVSYLKAQFGKAGPDRKMELINRFKPVQHPQLVSFWSEEVLKPYPPNLLHGFVDALGYGWDGQHVLYDLVRNGKLEGDLKTSAALHMMNCWDTEVRAAAPGYLTNRKGKSGDFLPDLNDLADREGMPEKGKLIFTNLCTTCHQINGEGVAFGPDLSQIGDKLSPRSIYSSIIYPSAGINFGYEGYVVKTADGSVYSGYITSQNDRELNLRMMGGITQTIARSAVSSLEPMESSLMTPNLYELMEVQDLVDLVAYLSTLKKEEDIR